MVEEGNNLQRRTRSMAEDRVSEVTDTVTKVADGVSKQASGSWDKLEQVFEDRVRAPCRPSACRPRKTSRN
ncbi:phasin family protein [Massilia sp. B-10]|nr:phasin family protein [Massilia sp. B-10]